MLKFFLTYRCVSCGSKTNIHVDKTDPNEPPQMFMRRSLKDTMYGTVSIAPCAVCCLHGYTKHEAVAIQAYGDELELHNLHPIKPAL